MRRLACVVPARERVPKQRGKWRCDGARLQSRHDDTSIHRVCCCRQTMRRPHSITHCRALLRVLTSPWTRDRLAATARRVRLLRRRCPRDTLHASRAAPPASHTKGEALVASSALSSSSHPQLKPSQPSATSPSLLPPVPPHLPTQYHRIPSILTQSHPALYHRPTSEYSNFPIPLPSPV